MSDLHTIIKERCKKFKDFYWEADIYKGRKLGIQEYESFNHQTSIAILEGIKKKLERMKIKENDIDDHFIEGKNVLGTKELGYNQALQDQIDYINSELSILTNKGNDKTNL